MIRAKDRSFVCTNQRYCFVFSGILPRVRLIRTFGQYDSHTVNYAWAVLIGYPMFGTLGALFTSVTVAGQAIKNISEALSYDEAEWMLSEGLSLNLVYEHASSLPPCSYQEETPATVRIPDSETPTVAPLSGNTSLINISNGRP
jgi:hypothetical protein